MNTYEFNEQDEKNWETPFLRVVRTIDQPSPKPQNTGNHLFSRMCSQSIPGHSSRTLMAAPAAYRVRHRTVQMPPCVPKSCLASLHRIQPIEAPWGPFALDDTGQDEAGTKVLAETLSGLYLDVEI